MIYINNHKIELIKYQNLNIINHFNEQKIKYINKMNYLKINMNKNISMMIK